MNYNLLRAARVKNGLRQSDIAKNLGISEAGYSKKETGNADFSLKQLIVLKEVLHLDILEFEDIFLKVNLN